MQNARSRRRRRIAPPIGFELGEPGLPLGDYLDSLELMTAFPDTRLLPAHGPGRRPAMPWPVPWGGRGGRSHSVTSMTSTGCRR
jgi:glyoxylase-like metal-dependent hydrolase (beta-lactamase superfamily II)